LIPIAKPVIDEDEIEAVIEVLRSGIIAQSKRVEEFERAFAEYIGVDYAIAVSNGTAALDIALKAAGIGEGDEVITTPFTFIATSNAILFQRARPLFADVDETYNIDPDKVAERITRKTKAVVGVHLYGHPFDIKPVMEICEDHNLLLIEDCAQAHGAEYEGQKVGSFGIGCFSFYATKNMTTAEGGMITCNDRKFAERCRLLRSHGETKKYEHTILGHNMRMTDIQAAMGLVQLKKIEWLNGRRIENARFYNENIKIEGLEKPKERKNVKHVYHQYVLRVENDFPMSRDELSKYLTEKGVGNAIHYPKPVYLQPLYINLGYSEGLCPAAEEASRKVISIPVHPLLTDNELRYIVDVINGVSR